MSDQLLRRFHSILNQIIGAITDNDGGDLFKGIDQLVAELAEMARDLGFGVSPVKLFTSGTGTLAGSRRNLANGLIAYEPVKGVDEDSAVSAVHFTYSGSRTQRFQRTDGKRLSSRQRRSVAVEPWTRPVPDDVRRDLIAVLNRWHRIEATGTTVEKEHPPRRQRRRTEPRPPTPKQLEVLHVVGEVGFAEAARRLGIHRKTLKEHYDRAVKKAGPLATTLLKGHTVQMPKDHREQADIAGDDDGPATIGPRPRVRRANRS
jgi:hypothetical protein